jgi:hypothetical protein
MQFNGVPFKTTGFFARLSRRGILIDTASFDSYRNGILFRVRTIPAGVETFAVIG